MPSGKKPGAGATKARPVVKATGKCLPAETKLAELKLRLLEISDLTAAGALLGWDQSTYMPRGGAPARARQGATLSKLAHEKSIDPALGKLLDELAPYAAGLPYQSDEASLIRVARRDFEKAIKVPSAYVARASALGSASYDAWTRARPANDFATMRPFLEQAVDLSREYAGFFAPYQHVADPLIDAAEEGMTTASIRSLFAELRSELLPIVHAISEQPIPSDDCLRGSFSAKSISGTRCSQQCTSPVMRFTSRELPQRLTARRLDREHRSAYTRASRGSGKMSSAAAARSGSIGPARYLPGSFPADRIRDLLSGDQQGATLLDPHGCLIVAGCGGEFIFGSRASDLQIAALNKEASEARLALEKIRNPSSLSGLTDDSDIR